MNRSRSFIATLLTLTGCLWSGGVEMSVSPGVVTAFQGEAVLLNVILTNRSALPIEPARNWFISYHLYAPDRTLVSFDNRRFPIPHPVRKGDSARFVLPVYFSGRPGKFRVELDVVKEGEFWGSQKGGKTAWLTLELKPLVSAEFKKIYLQSRYETGDRLIDSEQYLLRMIYRNGEMTEGGHLFGFAAGSVYPQVWIRDLATFISCARFYYPLADLQRMAELFLETQGASGDIMDWVDVRGRTDKNSVETDQESSLVLAAYEIALDDPVWLEKAVRGETVFARLEKALRWIWDRKRDERTGLILSGLTADWGDVENTYPDQRAIKWSDRSTPVFAIYTQAKYIQAIERLCAMARFMGETAAAETWNRRMISLRRQCRQRLYLKEAGYFRIHRVSGDPSWLDFERGILAVGGNAEAIRAGLMTGREVAVFLEALERRRREYRLGSVSFTLLPPYPDGFFLHPQLRSAWTYQNGGEWDWIGGRVIGALFQSGHRAKAEKYLREIIAKHLRNFNIFEWEDRAGVGRGASFYVGAAGVIGEAIWKGYFGFDQDFATYRIRSPEFPFRLFVDKASDRFAVTQGDQSAIRVCSLAGKTVCLYRLGKDTPLCADRKGETTAR